MKGCTVTMNQSIEHSTVIGFCPEQAENTETRRTILSINLKTNISITDHVMTLRKQEAVS